MLLCEREKLSADIKTWVRKFGSKRDGLLPVLQEIQRKYRHVPDFAIQELAGHFNISPVEVSGVVSFYSFLDVKLKGRYVIRLCRTIACDMAGKSRVARQLENELGISFGETTPDGEFSLEWVNCLGMCDQGPAMLINDKVYTRLTPGRVREIIEECRGNSVDPAYDGKEAD